MKAYVADTHALYWYLTDLPRLGPGADQAFDEADQGAAVVYVPAIALAELYYMNAKLGRPLDFQTTLRELQQSRQFTLLPFLAEETADLDVDQAVPEMHDRIIVGVARRLNAPLLTRDTQMTQSGVVTVIW